MRIPGRKAKLGLTTDRLNAGGFGKKRKKKMLMTEHDFTDTPSRDVLEKKLVVIFIG